MELKMFDKEVINMSEITKEEVDRQELFDQMKEKAHNVVFKDFDSFEKQLYYTIKYLHLKYSGKPEIIIKRDDFLNELGLIGNNRQLKEYADKIKKYLYKWSSHKGECPDVYLPRFREYKTIQKNKDNNKAFVAWCFSDFDPILFWRRNE